jgi:Fe-S oxidoreductase
VGGSKQDAIDPETLRAGREDCSYCPKLCRHVCPAAEAERSEQATPTFKQQVALRARSEPLTAERARVLYKCTTCRASQVACRHQVHVAASLRDARGQAVTQGVAPPEVTWLAERMAEHGSPYSQDLRALLADALGSEAGWPPRPGTRPAPVAYLPSCTALVHDPTEVRDAWRVLAALETRPAAATLPRPPCCGYPLDAAGHADAFYEHALRVATTLSAHDEVYVLGPACAHTIGVRYREVGVPVPFEVRPLVDVLDRVKPGRARPEADTPPTAPPTYHDPCYLGRWLGRYEAPRQALSALLGKPPAELPQSRTEARCAGGGGLYPLTNPEAATTCGGQVLEGLAELREERDTDVLLSPCASARRRMLQANAEAPVRSLWSYLAERLAPPKG